MTFTYYEQHLNIRVKSAMSREWKWIPPNYIATMTSPRIALLRVSRVIFRHNFNVLFMLHRNILRQ